jgi:hypothetical protein
MKHNKPTPENPFLYHGTSKEIVERMKNKHNGGYCRHRAGDPNDLGRNITGEVTSFTPDFLNAFCFLSRIGQAYENGHRLSEADTYTPTIIALTAPEKYRKSPEFGEREIVVHGIIQPGDFRLLDEDLEFIVDNFQAFYQEEDYTLSMHSISGIYETLAELNPGLKNYGLAFPSEFIDLNDRLEQINGKLMRCRSEKSRERHSRDCREVREMMRKCPQPFLYDRK